MNNMDASTTFLFVAYALSIAVYVVSTVMILTFVIPLQIKMAEVKNGLIKLRKQLLVREAINLMFTIITIVFLGLRFSGFDVNIVRYLLGAMVVVQSILILTKAIIDKRIYHQDYTPANLAKHARIDRLEKAEAKRERKAK